MKEFFKSLSLCLFFILTVSGCEELTPVAQFSMDVDSGKSPLTVHFTNQSVNAVSYLWDFGDGQISSEANPIHIFKYSSVFEEDFTVTLTAAGEKGKNSTTTGEVRCIKEILTNNPRTSDFDKWVDGIVMTYFNDLYICGLSLAFIDGSDVKTYHYGETDHGNGILPDNNTLYEIASVTKTFTSVSLINWLNQNNISLDAPVKDYLPESLGYGLSLNGIDVTFRHLLSHTSGLAKEPDNIIITDPYDPWKEYDSLRMYDYISLHKLSRTPGTVPNNITEFYNSYYSNLAFGLAGVILERQNHKTLQSIFEETVFNPAGMSQSTLSPLENFTNIAYPHMKVSEEWSYSLFTHYKSMAGCGGLKSNLSDLIQYVEFLLSASETAGLGQAVMKGFEPQYSLNFIDIGLPWWSINTLLSNKNVIYHDGSLPGYTSSVMFERNFQKGFIMMANNHTTDGKIGNLEDAFFFGFFGSSEEKKSLGHSSSIVPILRGDHFIK